MQSLWILKNSITINIINSVTLHTAGSERSTRTALAALMWELLIQIIGGSGFPIVGWRGEIR